MAIQIPLRTDLEDYTLQATLDQTIYTLRMRFNRRDQNWYMDVMDQNSVPIRMGLKVLIDWPLGVRTRNPLWPPGCFIAVDTSTLHEDPTATITIDNGARVNGTPSATVASDLGGRVVLLYFQKSELPVNPHNPV